MRYTKYIVIQLVLVFNMLSYQAFSQCSGNNTFTGATSSDWNTASNWSANCVPTSPVTGELYITANCVISSGSYTISGPLQIDKNVSLTNNSTGTFMVTGTISGEGTYIGDLAVDGDLKPGDVGAPPVFTCGDMLSYEGQDYATVMIGGQCWMAENLNVGTMVSGMNMSDDGIIEKYCYGDNAANCTTYGALYQWNEMMQYTTTESAKGICPTGWHLPSDDEYKTMEIFLGMSQSEADMEGYRGSNQGSQMAGNEPLWFDGPLDMNINFGSSGFQGLPGGGRLNTGGYFNFARIFFMWTSTESSTSGWVRYLNYTNSAVYRSSFNKDFAFSVRCVQDE